MADNRDGKQWAARWLLGASFLVALLGVVVAFIPITYSSESDSCGSAWSPDYPDRPLSGDGGCGYWITLMTRASLVLLVALFLGATAAWRLIRTNKRRHMEAVSVS